MGHERFVLGVDLDGVVADFYAGLREIAAEWTGRAVSELPVEVTYDLKEWDLKEFGGYEALHRFAIVERHLFEKLNPLAGAPAVLRKLSARDIRIRVITHRLFIRLRKRPRVSPGTECEMGGYARMSPLSLPDEPGVAKGEAGSFDNGTPAFGRGAPLSGFTWRQCSRPPNGLSITVFPIGIFAL